MVTQYLLSAATLSSGTGWATPPSQICSELFIKNESGTTIVFRNAAFPSGLNTLKDTKFQLVEGILNANQVEFRRLDVSATPVTIEFVATAR